MNIIPNGMNQGASHPIQAAQQMQPMNHVMHGGQPIGKSSFLSFFLMFHNYFFMTLI